SPPNPRRIQTTRDGIIDVERGSIPGNVASRNAGVTLNPCSATAMLESLRIQNYALIDDVELEFGPGFNVLTGETGAGKSIILGALNLVLGARAAGETLREGAAKA